MKGPGKWSNFFFKFNFFLVFVFRNYFWLYKCLTNIISTLQDASPKNSSTYHCLIRLNHYELKRVFQLGKNCHMPCVSSPARAKLAPRDHSACLENVASLLRRAKLTPFRTNFVWKNLSWTHLSFTRDPRNRASFWTSKRAKICMVSCKKYRHKLSGCNNPVQRGCKDKRYLITWSVYLETAGNLCSSQAIRAE